MKINCIINRVLFLAANCIFLVSNTTGQTSTDSGISTNLAAKLAKIEEKRAEWSRLHPEQEAEEVTLMSNAVSHLEVTKPWPKTAKNKKIIEHCVEQLRSAFDTNEIELACSKLTNQPETALTLKGLSNETMSNLNFLATILTNPDISDITRGDDGWSAEMYNLKNYYYLDFWTTNGEPSSVRSIEQRTPDAKSVILSARFYENGKLSYFEKVSPPGNQLSFKEDGHLNRYWVQNLAKKP